ncbi:LPS translocon maturation chaperone LptM [Aliivibrio kagoshimensis]|uniref:LPS translocon maturation chaperone LptM n=1 Tax=Aliivibrio kagoshimensis TaxID=2910230 RepID=UPI003D0FB3BD
MPNKLIAIFVLASALVGCGQKGPLFMPEETVQNEPAAQADQQPVATTEQNQ